MDELYITADRLLDKVSKLVFDIKNEECRDPLRHWEDVEEIYNKLNKLINNE